MTIDRSALLLAVACLLGGAHPLLAQPPGSPDAGSQPPDALHVFLDCPTECDEDFIRKEIDLVDYVRDRTEADVHVLLTEQATGAGGTEYVVQFIGARRFAGVDQTLTYVAPQTATEDDRRVGLVDALKRGLVRYLAETALAGRVTVQFAPAPAAVPEERGDPWNLWVFAVNLGGSTSGEESNTLASLQGGATANRTTEAWKLGVALNGSYSDSRFELSDTQSFRAVTRSLKASGQAVKSLSPHWSTAAVFDAGASTFLNYDLRTRAAGGIEFNLFPYSDSTRRILAAQYTVGFNTFDFRDETIFGKTSDRAPDHQLIVSFTMRQPWGSGLAEFSLSQLLDDPDKYNVGGFGDVNVRLFKGFSLNTYGSINRTQDQIYLPREGATAEEILVRQQQLATAYRYTVTFGITYTFGSIYNNVVNPRFGARSGGFEAF